MTFSWCVLYFPRPSTWRCTIQAMYGSYLVGMVRDGGWQVRGISQLHSAAAGDCSEQKPDCDCGGTEQQFHLRTSQWCSRLSSCNVCGHLWCSNCALSFFCPVFSLTSQTFDDFQRQYLAAVNGVAQFAPPSLAAYAFDAVWTLAVALNSTGLPSPTSSGMGAIDFLSREELQHISFPGITVRLAGKLQLALQ